MGKKRDKTTALPQERALFTQRSPAYIQALEQRCDALNTINKRLAQTLQSEGRLTIVYSDAATGVTDAYSQAQVEQIVQQTRDRQYNYDQLLGRAMVDLGSNLAALQAAAGCTNGPDTRRILRNVNADLLSSIDKLDNALTDLSKDQRNEIDWPGFNSIIQGARGLRKAVKEFNDTGNDEAKKRLENYIAEANPKIADMIRGSGKRRGTTSKRDDWLTVEFERRVKSGGLPQKAVDDIYTLLKEKKYDELTEGEAKALADLDCDNPVQMLQTRIRRKIRESSDRIILSAQDVQTLLD